MGHKHTSRRRGGTRFLIGLTICALLALPTAGCSGCRDDDAKSKQAKKKEAEAKKKKRLKKKPKPDIEEVGRLRTLPHTPYRAPRNKKERAKQDRERLFAKPGHWIGASHYVRANNRDFQGRMIWQPQFRDPRSSSMRPLPLKHVSYQMNASRPVVLSKEQRTEKRIDMTLFMPRLGTQSIMQYRYQRQTGGGDSMPIRRIDHMPAYQYHFVVLSSQPEVYRSLASERSMWLRTTESAENAYYRLVLIKPDRRTPLSANSLTWTSIAYLLWDDVDPSLLSEDQQQAMLDWLHWGGQLILSGPDSLELLRGSFLEPHLPARGGKSIELTDQQLQRLREIEPDTYRGTNARPLKVTKTWSAVELEVPEESSDSSVLLSTHELQPLIVERRIGRGRILLTAFRISQSDLREKWSGFDNFLNAYLLRRSARRFSEPDADSPELYSRNEDLVDWYDDQRPFVRKLQDGRPVPTLADREDPRMITGYRLFSRDAGYEYEKPVETDIDYYPDEMYAWETRAEPGIGGWSDENPVANTARETIRVAAGIEIPSPTFVIQVLIGYLIVLVPINWAIFRLIGRVEWAWIAAPLISIGGALTVIHLAQLDIGFVRSRTELAVVELQPEYTRAHVTRYTAIYTSLSTQYNLEFADSEAVVQPFPMQRHGEPYQYRGGDMVHYESGDQVALTGFHVNSNSTGVLHSEQMVDMGGTISLTHDAGGRIEVSNGTNMNLTAVAVVRRTHSASADRKQFRISTMGSLDAGKTATGTLRAVNEPSWQDDWIAAVDRDKLEGSGMDVAWQWLIDSERTHSTTVAERHRMLSFDDLAPGDTRLIAIAGDREIPGLTIEPAASQARHATLVVANLKFATGPAPGRDNRLPRRTAKRRNSPTEDLDEFEQFDNEAENTLDSLFP